MFRTVVIEPQSSGSIVKVVQAEDLIPKAGEVLIRNRAVGVNTIDVLQLEGKLPRQKNLSIGYEACGEVVSWGAGVPKWAKGDRVIYATGNGASYAEYTIVSAEHLISLPNQINYKTAAASFYKGLFAHALVARVYISDATTTIILQNATFALSRMIIQFAALRGVKVIGTVDTPDQEKLAYELGCKNVFLNSQANLVEEVKKITDNQMVNAVYLNSNADKLFNTFLDCLAPFGLMVCYDTAAVDSTPIHPKKLLEKSLFFTAPSMSDYKANNMERILAANDLFEFILDGKIKVPEYKEYPLEQANEALSDAKSGNSIILIP